MLYSAISGGRIISASNDISGPVLAVRPADIEDAVRAGVITEQQGEDLWRRWQRAGAAAGESGEADALQAQPAAAQAPRRVEGPRFGFTNVLYYFGGMVAISAMSIFMSIGWSAFGAFGLAAISLSYLVVLLLVADRLKRHGLLIPAGILATLAVVLVPLLLWCVQNIMGLWPEGSPENYSAYHTEINWRWLSLEFAALAAGAAMLSRYRLPFMVMPIAVTLWYISIDAANALTQQHGQDWRLARDVSLLLGIATCAIAVWVDIRTRRASGEWAQDFAFWLYIFGAIMFWGGLSLRFSDSELAKLGYVMTNVVLIFVGAAIGRRVFTVLGAFGVVGYLGYLSYEVFEDSLLFPFALTALGLALVVLGIWWQRNESRINTRLAALVPEGLRTGVLPRSPTD